MLTARTLNEKYDIERSKFDEIAANVTLDEHAVLPAGMDFSRAAREDTYLPGIAEFLGNLDGKRVLEVGCGVGKASVLLARSGARLSAFDISAGSVDVARRRAELNGVADRIEFRVAVGEQLPYENESFDIIFGSAILHHLEIDRAGPELNRVLCKGGRAAFSEPLAVNPVVEFARNHLWYPRKAKEGADAPLTYEDIAAWGAHFDECECQEIHLLGMLERLSGWRWQFQRLHRLDRVLTRRFPYLRRFCGYAVILLRKT